MCKAEKFLRAMLWLLLGIVIGFLIAPIKGGTNISILSNNIGTDFDDLDDLDDLDDEEEEEEETGEDSESV